MAMPLGEKSAWNTNHMPSVMATYSNLTILGSQNNGYACQANPYGLLACSALHMSLQPSVDSWGSNEYWHQAADQMFQQVKCHMRNSLKFERQEPKKQSIKTS